MKSIVLRLPEDLHKKARKYAFDVEMSMNKLFVIAIENHLNDPEIQPDKPKVATKENPIKPDYVPDVQIGVFKSKEHHPKCDCLTCKPKKPNKL